MKRRREIDELVREQVGDGGPGCAVLVVDRGEVVHARGYGLADLETAAPITTKSCFDLASVSKQFTAAAIVRLAGLGHFSIDDAVGDVLEGFAVPVEGRPVRVRDLLWHTSGLADYTGDAWCGSDREFADLTTSGLLTWLNGTVPCSAPGVAHEYNNSNYVLLARLVEEVAGKPFESFVRDAFLGPLEMHDTFLLTDHALRIPNRVTGYTREKGGQGPKEVAVPCIIVGDGNVFTTIEDLARWDAGLHDGRVLDHDGLREAWSNGHLDDGSPIVDEDGYGYGFGWRIETDGKDTCVWHSGGWAGTSTYVHRLLGADQAVAVLANDDTFEAAELGDRIGELVALTAWGRRGPAAP